MNKDCVIKNLAEISKQLALELEFLKKELKNKTSTSLALEAKLKELVHNSRKRYLRDIFALRSNSDCSTMESHPKLIFSKSFGNMSSIDKNADHEFARNHTIIHLKSNSICTWIPKNSCSSFRYSLAVSNGAISGKSDINWIHKNNLSFAATNKELLNANYAFVVLRNPFKRLLSFYCDKLCNQGQSEHDNSYTTAQKKLGTSELTTFREFVEILWKNPNLKKENKHIRDQCDFLVYKNYSQYFSLENYGQIAYDLRSKIGLELEDVRPFNSIITTYGCTESEELNYDTPARLIGQALTKSKKPVAKNMYSSELIQKVGILYFEDVLLYIQTIASGEDEMLYWINHMY